MKDCCIIIPIYNRIPKDTEILSIKRNCSVLNDYDIYFIHPFLLDVSAYEEIILQLFLDDINSSHVNDSSTSVNYSGCTVSELFSNRIHFIPFKNKYFKSNKSYSRLLLSEHFYHPFIEYEYMLIAQTDTYILNTEYTLRNFIDISRSCSYDYWGAPWPDGPFEKPYTFKDYIKLIIVRNPENIHVGNGGFSLRHIDHTLRLIHQKKNLIDFFWRFNEDMFFSLFAFDSTNKYSAASIEQASSFALETNMAEVLKSGKAPYAVHAWEKQISKDMLLSYVNK